MNEAVIWLAKLLLAHLLTDFILQPSGWVQSRRAKHFRSVQLYWHGLVTAAIAFLLLGVHYLPVVLIVLVTHLLIDGWKSYQPDNVRFFLLDQLLHLIVIFACWYFVFWKPADLLAAWAKTNTQSVWITATVVVFLTQPCAILIAQLTKGWRAQIQNGESLGNAGKWIGIIERIIILVLVLNQQYALVGLLMTAKGLLRFNEPARQEVKTEYLVIGTLISFGLAALSGMLVLALTKAA